MNCKIIKDLIPLSEEGLCSEESKAMIEEHIKDCESCRMLYEKIPLKEKSAPVPDIKETFKKVNRKMKKLTWKFWICGVALLAILGGLGYLTFGQITKMQGLHSFETIVQSFEVRKIVKYIAEGDFESYVDTISDGERYDFNISIEQLDKINENNVKLLEKIYQEEFGNTEVKKINVKSNYEEMFADDSYQIANYATIYYNDGRELNFDFHKDVDGKYISNGFTGAEVKNFESALTYANRNDFGLKGLLERIMLKDSDNYEILANRFNAKYQESFINEREKFFKQGFKIDNFYFSNYAFDEEKNMLYYDVTVEASDRKGKAVMTTRLYYDYLGFIPPERDTINVYTDNCTPELEKALYNYFG